ncbi:MAG TPA: TetR/AcrR family transcriptional regulator [Acidimicrobiia bacterium]|nr:TetR/AcrR family transcriptional regulator [Acidimicrobiia bacterium]
MPRTKAVAEAPASRPRKSDATRQRILDAAAKVFRDKGYAGARLTDIAAAAGMQAGSLYYHFASREELVEEVLRAGVEEALEFIRREVEALPPEAPATERLRTAIRSHLLMVLEIGDYTSANIRILGQLPEEIRKRHLVDQRQLGAYMQQLLEAARQAGEIRADVDLSVIRMLVFGALNWAVEWYQPGGRVTADEVANAFLAMIFEGLGTAPAKSAAARRNGTRRRETRRR